MRPLVLCKSDKSYFMRVIIKKINLYTYEK